MKRFLTLILCVIMLFSFVPNISATETTNIEQVINALEIMTGDTNGNMNLSNNVTRAEFSKMLILASTFKDNISATGNASPFKDVPYTHWAANYIKTAVNAGYITGYIDGSFRPSNPITLAEATTAVLKLLGYTSSDFSGSFPLAQMALLKSTGLGNNITGSATTLMTRKSAMQMFYNLLSVKNKDGNLKYVQVLGYSLDADGNPDYNAILQGTMDGPIVYTSGNLTNTLGFTPTTVYRDGAISSVSAIQNYDVLYYSASRKTVWSYTRRITGTFESASPSKDNPTSIKIAGTTYSVSSSTALYQLGTQGGLPIGTSITVLLGKNGDIVGAYSSDKISTEIIGLVTAKGSDTYYNANGSTYTSTTLSIKATDGNTFKVPFDNLNDNIKSGSLVKVSYDSSGANIQTLTKISISGNVTTTSIDGKKIASNINILDISDTVATKIYISRLNGLTLTPSDVYYYELNSLGEIDTLILNNVTGDAYNYGIVLSANENSSSMNAIGNYSFLIDGQISNVTTMNSTLGATTGPARFIMSNSQVSSLKALTELTNVSSISGLSIKNATETHTIWDYASVYVNINGTYTKLDISELSLSKYNIRAYYDKADTDGGRIRVIIATPK